MRKENDEEINKRLLKDALSPLEQPNYFNHTWNFEIVELWKTKPSRPYKKKENAPNL